jgi:hypothetical protein
MKPSAPACRIYPDPGTETRRSEKVATPSTAFTVSVPDRFGPVGGPTSRRGDGVIGSADHGAGRVLDGDLNRRRQDLVGYGGGGLYCKGEVVGARAQIPSPPQDQTAMVPARAMAPRRMTPQRSTNFFNPSSIIFQFFSEWERASSVGLLSWVSETRVRLPSGES